MALTVHDMVCIRKDMERAGFADDVIRDTIRARIAQSKAKPRPVARPTVRPNRPSTVARITPQSRHDSTAIGGYKMVAGFCPTCADHHPAGEHTL